MECVMFIQILFTTETLSSKLRSLKLLHFCTRHVIYKILANISFRNNINTNTDSLSNKGIVRIHTFFYLYGGTLGTAATTGLLYQARMIGDRWLWRNWWNKDWQGKPKYSEKTCPSATLSTTHPTWLNPGLNPGRRGGKPATNRLSYGAARIRTYFVLYITSV
jgi:hypothetical protein